MTEYTDSAGVRYIAKPQGDGKCSGCAHAYLAGECLDAPLLCDPMYAGDASRIVWVRTEPGGLDAAAIEALKAAL